MVLSRFQVNTFDLLNESKCSSILFVITVDVQKHFPVNNSSDILLRNKSVTISGPVSK